ncbi:hypothetical protein ACTL31_06890 [Leuconostoc mesenteroides]
MSSDWGIYREPVFGENRQWHIMKMVLEFRLSERGTIFEIKAA